MEIIMNRIQQIAFKLSTLWGKRASYDLPLSSPIEEAPMAQHVSLFERLSVYIAAWETRTGELIERDVEMPLLSYMGTKGDEKGKQVHVTQGSQFKNFSKFLGSREYKSYRKDNPESLKALFDVMTSEERTQYKTDYD